MTQNNTFHETLNADDYGLTKDRIQFIAAYMDEFQDRAEDLAEKYLKSLGHRRASITRLEYDLERIGIRYETSNCSCCQPDTDYESMPTRYLWDDDWEKEIDQIIAKRKKDEQEKKERDRKRAEAANRKRELNQLAALKAKYEKED